MSIEALQVMVKLHRVVLHTTNELVLHRSNNWLKATLSTDIIIAHHISAPKVANARCNFTAAKVSEEISARDKLAKSI